MASGYSLIQQFGTNVALKFQLVLSSDHRTPATGLSPSVSIRKEGGGTGYVAVTGTISEIGNGWYQVAPASNDTQVLGDIIFHATAATADNFDGIVGNVIAINPYAANFGNLVGVSSPVKKNQSYPNFPFPMTNSASHILQPSLVGISAFRSLDGAPFVPCANTPNETGNGVYNITLAPADTNGNYCMYLFTVSGADPRLIMIATQP